MNKIAVLTSGGDSPGMNACIRAVVRTALSENKEVIGVRHGYQGLIEGDFVEMDSTSVSNIIQRGGTILKTARSEDFRTVEGRKKAYDNLIAHNIDGLVVIGGDGTFTGALVFSKEFDFPIVGAPGTIDNDLFGTDYSIGYDTALNTVIEAVDKIRDTAQSHDRLFFIEVMGRDAGFIALRSGIAVGAEAILIPETHTYIDHLIEKLGNNWRHNKKSNIVIVAEGEDFGGAYDVANAVKEKYPYFDIRVSVLGHIQRGGNPTALDRVIASRMGVAAVQGLLEGKRNVMVGIINKQIEFTSFEKSIKHHHKIDKSLLDLAEILSN